MRPLAKGWAKVRNQLPGDTKEVKAATKMAFKQSSPRPCFVDLTGEDYKNRMAQIKDFAKSTSIKSVHQKNIALLAEGRKYLAAFSNHYPSESDEGKMLQMSSKWRATLIALRYEAHARVAQDFAKPPQSLQRRAKAAPAALEMLIHACLKF